MQQAPGECSKCGAADHAGDECPIFAGECSLESRDERKPPELASLILHTLPAMIEKCERGDDAESSGITLTGFDTRLMAVCRLPEHCNNTTGGGFGGGELQLRANSGELEEFEVCTVCPQLLFALNCSPVSTN
jgi:hypothetical protein